MRALLQEAFHAAVAAADPLQMLAAHLPSPAQIAARTAAGGDLGPSPIHTSEPTSPY